MTAFDTRAIENIATAPAQESDRRWALTSAGMLLVLLLALLHR